MRAVILAGGRGTRLLPYTIVIPKPMLPLGEMPVIEIIARQLKFHGFNDAVISLGYMGPVIENFLKSHLNDSKLPALKFFTEDQPLGTSGVIPHLFDESSEEDLLVINGDVITTLNLREMYERHKARKAILTIAIRKATHTLPLGSVTINQDGFVTQFNEKPTLEFLDNIGVYVYSSKIRKYIGLNEKIDINKLVERLIEAGEKVDTFYSEGLYYWMDIGTHADYEKANKEIDGILKEMPYMKENKE